MVNRDGQKPGEESGGSDCAQLVSLSEQASGG